MNLSRRDFTRLSALGLAAQLAPQLTRNLSAQSGDRKIGYCIIGLGRIADHFMRGIQVAVIPFMPRTVEFEAWQRSAIGTQNNCLGQDLILGSKTTSLNAGFRTSIGPIPYQRYSEYLDKHLALQKTQRDPIRTGPAGKRTRGRGGKREGAGRPARRIAPGSRRSIMAGHGV